MASGSDRSVSSEVSFQSVPTSQNDAAFSMSRSTDSNAKLHTNWHDYKRYLHLVQHKDLVRDDAEDVSSVLSAQKHELGTAPLFSGLVRQHILTTHLQTPSSDDYEPFIQFGLLGIKDRDHELELLELNKPTAPYIGREKDLIFANIDAPCSTFICGSQGGGKSHTLSCLLENALIKNSPTSKMSEPLTGIVFHFDKFSGFKDSQLCEAAYLCSHVDKVRILVAPTSEYRMRQLYSDLPGLPAAKQPQVVPFYLQERHLDISNLIKLMAVTEHGIKSPLYLELIYDILRQMVKQNQHLQGIDYRQFVHNLSQVKFTKDQLSPLHMRLQLLRSFLDPRVTGDSATVPTDFDELWEFRPGTLTIVDLSDPFVDAQDACTLFSICLSIFMSSSQNTAKVIALDEAHKFLTQTGAATRFTEDLLQVVRQQRHLGARVIIATQEPTLSPQLLDLSNTTIIHHFNSPAWFHVLQNHLAGVKASDTDREELFREIVQLRAGEALLFCPSAVLDVSGDTIVQLGDRYTKLKIRQRITADGGKSLMASQQRERGSIPPLLTAQSSGPFEFSEASSGDSRQRHLSSDNIANNAILPVPSTSAFNFSQATASKLESTPLPPASSSTKPANHYKGFKSTFTPTTSISPLTSQAASRNIGDPRPMLIPKSSQGCPSDTAIPISPGALKTKKMELTEENINKIMLEIVASELSQNSKLVKDADLENWRKVGASKMGRGPGAFRNQPWKKISKISIRRAVLAFYQNKLPPHIARLSWMK